jgi:CO/xanthine dehydrogenase Mo-binding subunit
VDAPYNSGAHASRSALTTGWAAKRAVEDAREHLFRVAADLLEASAADLELAAGHVRVKGVPAPCPCGRSPSAPTTR